MGLEAIRGDRSDGRLFGRGTADDKAGIAAHAATLLAWAGAPPVTISVFIEGEEEIASPNIEGFLRKYSDLLQADVIVLADCSNRTLGRPAPTTSLRGILDFIVEVRTLDHAVHSGVYGGPVPDASTALCRLVASLHDDRGNVTVEGLHSGPPYDIEVSEADIRRFASVRPSVWLMGTGTLAHRLWGRLAAAVLGIDAPPTAGAAEQTGSCRAREDQRPAGPGRRYGQGQGRHRRASPQPGPGRRGEQR